MENYFEQLVLNNTDNFYLGTGNPSAKILIIGKEAAIDSNVNNLQYKREILNNAEDWKSNLENKINQVSVKSWFSEAPIYNPLYPYKGQLNKVENRRTGNNGGTSRTFYNYQKLISKIFFSNFKKEKIDFHEECFITEFNSASALYSHLTDQIETNKSVTNRLDLLNHPFYQNFPVIIVAAGNYVNKFNIDLEKLFNVKEIEKIDLKPYKSNFMFVYKNDSVDNKKIVIHTNQLSMNISDLLLQQLSIHIKDFLQIN